MVDNYEHVDNKVIYIESNIPGPPENTKEFAELKDKYDSQILIHCLCVNKCVYPTCVCLMKTGANYTVYEKNGLPKYKLIKSKNPIFECNSQCSCLEECGNRVVQKGPIDGLIIIKCPISEKGFGLFTSNIIPSGTFICEYAGELLTKPQALYRNKYNQENCEMNYIFCLNEVCDEVGQQTFVDPKYFGNIGRYINHSCDPNCYIVPVRCDMPIPKLAIFALRDILPDTEITFDYGSNIHKKTTLNNNHIKRKQCLCNSSNCKQFLPYDEY